MILWTGDESFDDRGSMWHRAPLDSIDAGVRSAIRLVSDPPATQPLDAQRVVPAIRRLTGRRSGR